MSSAPLPLEFCEVTKVYGAPPAQVVAVDRVSLAVHEGEVVVIIGPSGSGKTTLLSLAGCLLRPTVGRVRVMGTDVTRLSERRLPDIRICHIGFVFQSFNLLEPLSAEENVRIAMNLAGHHDRTARARAHALLEELGLGARAGRRPYELSAGERQRVAIARALANRPDVILADEPTANLDAATGHRVMGLLTAAIRRGEAKALVVVTHDSRVLDVADRVLRMEDGRLTEESPVATALAASRGERSAGQPVMASPERRAAADAPS